MSSTENIPSHIAIIMDGNGRWAKKNNKNRSFGHRKGSETVIKIVEASSEFNIRYLTLYAFSTENWKRPEEEKKYLFKLLKEFYKKEIKRLTDNNVLIKHIGDITAFPKDVYNTIIQTEIETLEKCHNPKLTVTIALNYGFRYELKDAIKNIILDYKENKFGLDDIDETFVSNYLYTKDIPEPDLIIRTSGEHRLSNFLMYQASYSEFYFTDVLWPDFTKEEYKKAIDEYSSRNRRYGGL